MSVTRGTGGFRNAPVSKAILLCLGLNTFAATALGIRQNWGQFSILKSPQLFLIERLIASNFFFSSTSDLLLGSCILYSSRHLERRWSGRKYVSFAFITSVISTILNFAALKFASLLGWRSVAAANRVPIGPYGLIFAALYQFSQSIPDAHGFKVLGQGWSDHVLLYFLGSQVLLGQQYPHSLLSGLCGLIAGALYSQNVLGIQKWRFPPILQRAASALLLPLLRSSPPRNPLTGTTLADQADEMSERFRTTRAVGGIGRQGGIPSPRPRPASASPVAVEPPSTEAIATLEGMGFPRERVLEALRMSRNDVNRAAAALLDA
ncbi:uncharacterized protein EV422DRAFT_164138 [Fimicolochytrium jonesii]|uniref:uncharacterized protein n=1 Tax=Fimicolochytrium jonesii TaxID=1396493 RepID=UPI0022FE1359|nr:uncharacterized protein EV422DRAFT_164138 [Fimicolochytrium jonesii]KAI8818766.1 hypothetical protein EV422DRAFT_164138 [Fimicolochytrium jonesii]